MRSFRSLADPDGFLILRNNRPPVNVNKRLIRYRSENRKQPKRQPHGYAMKYLYNNDYISIPNVPMIPGGYRQQSMIPATNPTLARTLMNSLAANQNYMFTQQHQLMMQQQQLMHPNAPQHLQPYYQPSVQPYNQ